MLLAVDDLVIEFATEDGLLRAVDGLSFGLDAGKTLGVVGESGCGKSVTALSLVRLLPVPAAKVIRGSIRFEGQEILDLGTEDLRRLRGGKIGFVFQEPMTALNPVYSVGFQIAEAMAVHQPKETRPALKEQTIGMMKRVGIPEPERRYDDYPHQLSGGLRQRVMIAMALACQPKLLIADEPTTALDVTIQAQILDLVGDLKRELGMAVILITHDLGIVAETTDEVMVMYAGKAVEKAATQELFARPLHPYTLGLLASLPDLDRAMAGQRPARLKGIPGTVPDLKRLPPGCRFQERCSAVQPACREREPELEEKWPGHWVSCFEVKP